MTLAYGTIHKLFPEPWHEYFSRTNNIIYQLKLRLELKGFLWEIDVQKWLKFHVSAFLRIDTLRVYKNWVDPNI